jgi:hypothetical protein
MESLSVQVVPHFRFARAGYLLRLAAVRPRPSHHPGHAEQARPLLVGALDRLVEPSTTTRP